MDKTAKRVLSIMFIVLSILISLALLDEGREIEIEKLEKINLEELHHE
jgi:hypothetical protein|tara:strand:- start:654 stop:797 length:144 start_codon:yes stop_codon:yes gene_type:complete